MTVERVPIVSGQNPVADGEADDYFCPVCGIGLSKIRLRHAGEGLLRSLLQHTPDPVGAVAGARALASAQDAATGTSDQDLIRAET